MSARKPNREDDDMDDPCLGGVGSTAEDLAQQLYYQRSVSADLTAFVQMRLAYQEQWGAPTPLRSRSTGKVCGDPECPYRHVIVRLHVTLASALRAASDRVPRRGELARYVAHLGLVDALAVDATDVDSFDEARLRAGDPAALELLRALRDTGVVAIWIRAIGGGETVVLFTDAFDDVADIYFERVYRRKGDTWYTDEPADDDRDDSAKSESVSQAVTASPDESRRLWPPRAWGRRSTALFVAWECALAYAFAKAAGPLVGLFGAQASVPLLPVIAVSLLVGWLVGRGVRALCPLFAGLKARWPGRARRIALEAKLDANTAILEAVEAKLALVDAKLTTVNAEIGEVRGVLVTWTLDVSRRSGD